MPEEFSGDLAESVFWGADLRQSTFRDVDLTGSSISHAFFVDVNVDAIIDSVVINGVDVTAYVNERDPWHPLRSMLHPTTPPQARATWAMLDAEWATTIDVVHGLSEAAAHQSVDGEFSFVQTLRHLVFAIDKWFTAPVLGDGFHPYGLPNSGSVDFPWPGLRYDLNPSLVEVLDVRSDRARRFVDYVESLSADDLSLTVEVLENGAHSLLDCLHTVVEEEFWHLRYARRDLATLTGDEA